MPFIDGSTTASTAGGGHRGVDGVAARCSTCRPAAEASDWLVAIMPRRPTAGDRVAEMWPDGRSPERRGAWVMVIAGGPF